VWSRESPRLLPIARRFPILLLIESDGTLVLGSDDYKNYFAGFRWVAPADGTYQLQVTTFEAVGTGSLTVTRK
jgi:hypothetical protein